jgi:hypothetical protein
VIKAALIIIPVMKSVVLKMVAIKDAVKAKAVVKLPKVRGKRLSSTLIAIFVS